MQERIFIAEDDDNIRELLRCTLESYNYNVQCFEGAVQMLDALKNTSPLPELIMLDIMMPVMDGISALKILKSNKALMDIPIVMLTAKSGEVDKVIGLDMGADDYITKPFGLLELTARVRATLRRNKSTAEESILLAGDLILDLDNHEVTRNGDPLELTLKEYELLKLLIQNNTRVVPREDLLEEVWGYDYIGGTRTLDMHIKTLRQKLSDDAENPRYIKTVRSVGYKFIGKQEMPHE